MAAVAAATDIKSLSMFLRLNKRTIPVWNKIVITEKYEREVRKFLAGVYLRNLYEDKALLGHARKVASGYCLNCF